MHWTLKLLISIIAGTFAFAFVSVALAAGLSFVLVNIFNLNDPGIGAGLIAVACGMVAAVVTMLIVFRRLPVREDGIRQSP